MMATPARLDGRLALFWRAPAWRVGCVTAAIWGGLSEDLLWPKRSKKHDILDKYPQDEQVVGGYENAAVSFGL